MVNIELVVIFSLLGGAASLLGALGILTFRSRFKNSTHLITSFAAGVLISISVLDLLPESLSHGEPHLTAQVVMAGILFLFLLEKTKIWFHHHHEPHGRYPNILGVWVGDTIHNFIDGLAIGGAFLISPTAGMATSLAVGLHELPKEMADFGLYIKAGFSNRKTILLNLISSLFALIGAVTVYLFGAIFNGIEYYLLAFTAGMFLYIALADLIPELHDEDSGRSAVSQLAMFFIAIGLAYLSISLLE